MGRAGRADEDGNALGVEVEQKRLAFHIGEAEVEAAGKSLLHASIDPGIFDPFQDQEARPVPQIRQPLAFSGHILGGQVCRPG